MERLHWTKVIMVVLILSLCISIVATTVSSLVHTKSANNSWEGITLVSHH
jgi:hypothetical protein